jgi:pimeloyl-ACP methyl ester carboxylesterase
MQASVQCFEEVPFTPYNDVLTAAEGVEPHIAHNYAVELESLYTICETWGSGMPNAYENQPTRSDIPALILAGQFDPITPPAWGELTAQSLSQVYYYKFPNAGHWVMRSGPCPIDVAVTFLNDPYAPPDASCIAAINPLQFVP